MTPDARSTARLATARLAAFCGVLGAAFAPTPAAAQLTEAEEARVERCLIDDPGLYQTLRRQARAASTDETRVSIRDLPAFAQACDVGGDPHAYPEEIALPMPCGGRMLFRRVTTPAENPLAQDTGFFGDIDAENAGDAYLLSASPWSAPVSGPFPLPSGLRAYYIGKYEVTGPQYSVYTQGLFNAELEAALDPASEICADYERSLAGSDGRQAPRPQRVFPAGGLDWHASIGFARAYTDWLLRLDRARVERGEAPVLPWRNGSTGYLRLPTEAEWEYAARGGDAGRERRAQRWPDLLDLVTGERRPAESLDEIAFVENAGSRSLLDGVGRRAPNVIGIYDVVGNVEEIALDLFRLVRPDGLHGLAGGFVARGGSSLTPAGAIGVGARREIPLASVEGGDGARVTGARLMISAPVFAAERPADGSWRGGELDRQFTADARAAREALARQEQAQGGAAGSGGAALEDLVGIEEQYAQTEQLDRGGLRRQLAELRVLVERANAEAAEARRDALRDRAVATVAIGWATRQTGQRLYVARQQLQRALDTMEQQNRPRDEIRRLRDRAGAALRRIDGELNAQFGVYLDGIVELSELPEDVFADVLESASVRIAARGAEAFGDAPAWVAQHVAETRAARREITREMRQAFLFTVDEFRQRRRETFGPLPR